ncbi:unnamed protein product [Caenorhabditis brenneri]
MHTVVGRKDRGIVLNKHYKGFFSEVYGETNIPQIASTLDELNATEEDVFVDFGRGLCRKARSCVGHTIHKSQGLTLKNVVVQSRIIFADDFIPTKSQWTLLSSLKPTASVGR